MPRIAGKDVGGIGLGMIPLTPHAGPGLSEETSFAVLRAAVESGTTVWDGAEFYGSPDYNSLVLLNKYFTKYPEDAKKVALNIKGASLPTLFPNGKPEFIRQSVETCLRQLGGVATIDMFEMGRRDINVPFEDSLNAIAALVQEGKIGGVALSEVNAETIRMAASITKITAVEVELSLWVREPLTNGITKACHDLGIPILAYCPLGRGMLSSKLQSQEDIPEFLRKMFPRYQGENFQANLKLVRALEAFASRKGCTMAQLALGWLRTLATRPNMPEIIPIPGTIRADRVKENANPATLSESEMTDLDKILEHFEVLGERYPSAFMALTDL